MPDFKIAVVIGAVDKASAPIRRIGARIAGSLGGAVRRVGSGIRRLTNTMAVAVPAAAVGAAYGIWHLTESYAEQTDAMAKLVRRSGLQLQAYQELRHAANLAGVSQAQFDSAIVKFTRNVGDAKAGTGALATLLKKVSPELLKQVKAAKSNGEALEIMLFAMGSLDDPTKRAALAAAAFGEAGQSMTLMLEGGPEGMRKAREEARRLGGVLDGEAAAAAEAYCDDMARLKLAINGVKTAIGRALIPVLQPMVQHMTEWLAANRELVSSKIAEYVQAIGEWIGDAIDTLKGWDWSGALEGAKEVWGVVKDIAGAMRLVMDVFGLKKPLASQEEAFRQKERQQEAEAAQQSTYQRELYDAAREKRPMSRYLMAQMRGEGWVVDEKGTVRKPNGLSEAAVLKAMTSIHVDQAIKAAPTKSERVGTVTVIGPGAPPRIVAPGRTTPVSALSSPTRTEVGGVVRVEVSAKDRHTDVRIVETKSSSPSVPIQADVGRRRSP